MKVLITNTKALPKHFIGIVPVPGISIRKIVAVLVLVKLEDSLWMTRHTCTIIWRSKIEDGHRGHL